MDSKKAALALKLEPHFAQQARKNQLASLKQFADNKPHEGILEKDTVNAILHERTSFEKQTISQAGKTLGTGGRYVAEAQRISKEAPELIPQIERGEVTIQQAKQIRQ